MGYATIRDLTAAVLSVRPDCAAAGVTITEDHVLAARHEAGIRYEDIDGAALNQIIERAVDLALQSKAAATLGRKGGLAGRGASQVRGGREHYQAIRAKRQPIRYRVVAPPTPGARAVVDETTAAGIDLQQARRVARSYAGRHDLTYQDVRIEYLDGRLREYAGPAR